MLILGGRYGTIEPSSGKSYTRLEYEFAKSNNIPVFTIVLNEQFLANKKSKDIATKVYEYELDKPSIAEYKSFKETVMSNLVSIVEDANQIITEVSLALKEFIEKDLTVYQFRGWERGSEKPDPKKYCIGKNMQSFIDEKKRQGLVGKTIESYSRDLVIFTKYFNDTLITEIDTSKIKEFLRFREDNYRITSTNTLEKIRGVLNVFFDWLVEENIVKTNPVRRVKAFKFYKKGNESLNSIELNEIRKACITQREKALIEFLVSTGCRLSELSGIEINHINWSNNTINLCYADRERIVILTDKAKKAILQYLESRSDQLKILFVTERKPYRQISNRGIQCEIGRIVARTSISKKITVRTFRNTFSENMLDKGYCQWNTLQVLLGYHPKRSRSETFFTLTNDNIWKMVNSIPEI